MLVDVNSCARCGMNHEGIKFKKIENPSDGYEWFGTCPTTGQPVMLKIQ